MPCLTIIDVAGIQNYIFGSNRLKEIIGGSEIVAQATSTWVFEVLREEFREMTNLKNSKGNWFELIDKSKQMGDSGNLDAELIYAGGGNTVILFKSEKEATAFTRKYTRKLVEDAAGLDVVIAHSKDFQMNDGKVILDRLDETFEKLNLKKSNRKMSVPLLGLAVTAQCVSTGGVATSYDKLRENYISTESKQKLDFAEKADDRLKQEICVEVTDWKGLEIPKDFDDLGRTRDEASYVAVVHTDGNGMGERIKQNRNGKDNRECIKNMREFSHEINEANKNALQATISELLHCIDSDKQVFESTNGESFDLIQKEATEKNGNKKTETYFPFRPLIFGGDDLTFVCDGRIALALTAFYFKKLKENKLKADSKPIYSRAGISIIKTHYPFRRAYELAEDLAKSAKDRIKEIDENKKEVFAMDWHIAMSGLLGNIKEIRKREYLDGKLCMRPITLDNYNWQTWENFIEITNKFQGEKWKDKRNKVKRLREVLREGDEKTKEFLILFKEELPTNISADGWRDNHCVHFDAIEMLDLFYPIEENTKEAKG